MSSEEQLRTLGLSSLGEKEAVGQPHCSLQLPEQGSGKGVVVSSTWYSVIGCMGNGSKLCQGRIRLENRKHFFTKKVIKD